MSASFEYQDDVECPLPDNADVTLDEMEKLFNIQRDVLEDIALGVDYLSVLNKLCRMAEQMVPNSLSSIMLLDSANKLQVKAAPSIPEDGIKALNGLEPGPQAGSCGTTVYKKSPTFVINIMTDSRWANMRELAKDFGLGACWSMPVQVNQNQVIGSFALTSFEPGSPNIFQRRLLDTCAYIVGIIIQKHSSETELDYRLKHDSLTGLPNREKLCSDAEILIQDNRAFSLLMIGIDRFKAINDSHGHNIGDQVLISLTKRLREFVSQNDYELYRIGGDEFIFIVSSTSTTSIKFLEQHLKVIFSEPVSCNLLSFYLSASGGYSQFNPEMPTSYYTLMKQADMAMTVSKQRGRKDIVEYEPSMSVKVEDALALEGELHEAVLNHQFEVYYQPIVTQSTGQANNLEALIRWNHPEKGVISPGLFIPLAEEMGIVKDLTHIVLSKVIHDLKAFEQAGFDGISVSVNVSGKEFNQKQVQLLVEQIVQANCTSQIEFELTESYLMDNAEEVLLLLEQIRTSGIKVSIDDFGTGYSSLSYLKKFPVDKLKIDQSLIRDVAQDDSDLQITKAVVAMANSLGLKVVAEGVENEEIKSILESESIDYLQGYYFAKPQPITMIIDTLKSLS